MFWKKVFMVVAIQCAVASFVFADGPSAPPSPPSPLSAPHHSMSHRGGFSLVVDGSRLSSRVHYGDALTIGIDASCGCSSLVRNSRLSSSTGRGSATTIGISSR